MAKLKTYILTIEECPPLFCGAEFCLYTKIPASYRKKIKAKSLTEAKTKLLKIKK